MQFLSETMGDFTCELRTSNRVNIYIYIYIYCLKGYFGARGYLSDIVICHCHYSYFVVVVVFLMFQKNALIDKN